MTKNIVKSKPKASRGPKKGNKFVKSFEDSKQSNKLDKVLVDKNNVHEEIENLIFFVHSLHSSTDSKCSQKLSQLFTVLFDFVTFLFIFSFALLIQLPQVLCLLPCIHNISSQIFLLSLSFKTKIFFCVKHFSHVLLTLP